MERGHSALLTPPRHASNVRVRAWGRAFGEPPHFAVTASQRPPFLASGGQASADAGRRFSFPVLAVPPGLPDYAACVPELFPSAELPSPHRAEDGVYHYPC